MDAQGILHILVSEYNQGILEPGWILRIIYSSSFLVGGEKQELEKFIDLFIVRDTIGIEIHLFGFPKPKLFLLYIR